MAGNFRKAMGLAGKEADTAKRIQPESEASQAAARSAAVLVQLGFAAFAVSAYIRSSLCPALQTPQPRCLSTQVSICIIADRGLAMQFALYIAHHECASFFTIDSGLHYTMRTVFCHST